MGAESVVSSLPGLGVAETVLDLLPVGITLVEPGTGRELYANRTARRLAAGEGAWLDGDARRHRRGHRPRLRGLVLRRDALPGRLDRARADRAPRPVPARLHRGVRPALPARFPGPLPPSR